MPSPQTPLPRLALNALHQETTLKRSLRQKVKRAAMNNDYMMQKDKLTKTDGGTHLAIKPLIWLKSNAGSDDARSNQ